MYAYIPERILWDVLWKAAVQLSPVGQKSSRDALADPEGQGSIVERIMGEAIEQGVWFAKKTLKRDEPQPEEEESTEPPHELLKAEEKHDRPKKATRKATRKTVSKRRAAPPASK